MRDFFEIISVLKEKNNLKSETQIAKLLGMTQQTFSAYKKRGTIPYQEIIQFCYKESLSLDWLFFDVGEDNLIPDNNKTFKEVGKKLEEIKKLLNLK